MNANNASAYYGRIDYVQTSIIDEFVQSEDEAQSMFEMLEHYIIEKKLVDYVYEVDKLIELRGNSYHTKRTEINRFQKSYPTASLEILNTQKHGEGILHLYNK